MCARAALCVWHGTLTLVFQPYIGTTKHDGEEFDNEVSSWAREQLTITRRDGVPIKTRRDLEDLGFQVDVLHESSFMFNCRVLETHLHATFHSDNRRLWQKIGTGSYSSDVATQVRNPMTNQPSTSSCSLIVSGPTGLREDQ